MTNLSRTRELAGPWREVELELRAEQPYENPYVDVDVWVDFAHESGARMRRPAFWDGEDVWKARFAPTRPGTWTWASAASRLDGGLGGEDGTVVVADAGRSGHAFEDHGFWRMSPGGRSLVHADGTPALLVADTAWALPWRGTPDQVLAYARDRAAKGFNAVLLMSVQPDMGATGPRDRLADGGFDVGFEDLHVGRLNELVPEYFRRLDELIDILVRHEIVPVLQPVFQGFGWKGLSTAGPVVPPAEYARYCRYLVARYGARPAVYLVGADGLGEEPQVDAGGREVEEWDAYGQPTGVHYRPHACNRAHQHAAWLDFQWCQTGHTGEHAPERVADMWRNRPIRAVANGEPTYEHTRLRGMAEGWWQGHEAWSNLCAGGTMGVVYGAASLWQWRLHPDEPGHDDYFLAPGAGWREALEFEGGRSVGIISRILADLPTTDMAPDWTHALAPRGLLVPGLLFICYRELGGDLRILDDGDAVPRAYRVVDPQTGEVLLSGIRAGGAEVVTGAGDGPRVFIFHDGFGPSVPG